MQTSRQVIGMVTQVDLGEGHVRLKEDDESFCTLCCGGGTHILGEEEPLALGGRYCCRFRKGQGEAGRPVGVAWLLRKTLEGATRDDGEPGADPFRRGT